MSPDLVRPIPQETDVIVLKRSRIGYIRRLASEVLPESVRSAILAESDELFEDDLALTSSTRPALKLALGRLRRGDVFVVVGLRHLGMSTKQLVELMERLENEGVRLCAMEEGIEGDSAWSAAVIKSGAIFAAAQRELRRERISEGVREAVMTGRRRGARPSLSANNIATVRRLMQDTDLTMAQIAESIGTSRNTLYRTLKRATAAADNPSPDRVRSVPREVDGESGRSRREARPARHCRLAIA